MTNEMMSVTPSMEKEKQDSSTVASDDDVILVSMGYKKDLHRGLSGIMNFAFGYTEVAVLISMAGQFGYGLGTGGPAGLIWTWVTAYIMTMVVSFSMAEICSAYPSAGSVYHWAGQLVPLRWARVSAYTCGLTNFLGNFAGDASFAMTFASLLGAAMVASDSPKGFQGFDTDQSVGIAIAVLFVWSILNCFRVDKLGAFANLGSIVQFSSTFIIIIIILARAKTHSTGSFVFTEYYNNSGFTDKSYVGAIGLLAALFSFSGYEASAHMSEETHGSRVAAPMGIVWTCLATGATGLLFLLGMLFCTDDIAMILVTDDDSLLGDSGYVSSGNAAVEVFRRSSGDSYGSGLAWLLVINCFFAGVSSVTVTGRITFALARDKCFPMSEWIASVHSVLKSPAYAILLIWFLDSLLILLALGSEVAFLSITGIATIGFQVSYAIPVFLKLIFHTDYFKDDVTFPKTPMDLGVWSKIVGVISCVWLFGTSCLLFLPSIGPFSAISEDSMNWSIVIVGGLVFLALINWIFNAQFSFQGPKRYCAEAPSVELGEISTEKVM